MKHVEAYLLSIDLTDIYAILVWAGALLGVAWMMMMSKDPANEHIAPWHIHARKLGLVMLIGGFMTAALFGDSQKWVPWPPVVLAALGLDVYLAAAVHATRQRIKICLKFPFLPKTQTAARALDSAGV